MSFTRALTAALFCAVSASSAFAADEACRVAMHDRVETCTRDCVDKARAALDPSVRDMVVGRACAKNCLKIEMFHGQVCP